MTSRDQAEISLSFRVSWLVALESVKLYTTGLFRDSVTRKEIFFMKQAFASRCISAVWSFLYNSSTGSLSNAWTRMGSVTGYTELVFLNFLATPVFR